MSEGVKTRPYNSPRRRAQAAATRRQILEAAQSLFERSGWSATTMAGIATEAGVSLKTVYLAFETKSGVVRALWNLRLRGDEEEVPMGERQWYREVLEEADPERKLRLMAHQSRLVKERITPMLRVIRTAAPVEPDIAALWARIQSDFYENQSAIVATLHKGKALRRGLDPKRASDIVWTLNHPDLWELLVGERGWTPKQHERWLADTLCAQLLGD
jgi:AcrR family transcriptional regulator